MSRTEKLLVFGGLLLVSMVWIAVLLVSGSTSSVSSAGLPTAAMLPTDVPQVAAVPTSGAANPSPVIQPVQHVPVSQSRPVRHLPDFVPALPTQTVQMGTDTSVEVPSESLPEPIPNQIVLRFDPSSSLAERQAYVRSLGGTITQQIDALDTVVVTVPTSSAAQSLPTSPVLAGSEPDYLVHALIDVPTSDPHYSEQWGLPVVGAPDAWLSLPADAPTVTVAVIDSGVCAAHPDLAGRLLPGHDYVENDDTPQDSYGHGCAVTGVIAANDDNGIGIAGVAPNAMILPLRVLDGQGLGSYSNVAAAIVAATDAGAQIINLSLGGSAPSSVLESAVNYADAHGVTIVAAAGNTGGDLLYPAAYAPVVAVGSVDQDLSLSSFSSRGPGLDLLAPGRDILSTSVDDGYTTLSGTSFAAPYVSGVAALETALGGSLVLDGNIVSVAGNQAQVPEAPASSTESSSPQDIPLRVMVPHPDLARQMDSSGQSITQIFPQMDPVRAFSPGPKMDVALGQAASFKTLAILVQFTDQPSQVGATSFDSLLFSTTGSTVNTYYDEVSYGQLDIVTVNLPSSIGWQTAPHPYSYYVNGAYCTDPDTYPNNCQGLTEDLVTMVNTNYPAVDFSQYDNNGDGWVDTVFIIHSGTGAELTGSVDDIWSHSWTTYNPPLVDGVYVGSYTVEPEYWYTPGDMTIGVYAHELGHALGLPDLYDIDVRYGGVGQWSLMADGVWNGAYLGDSPAQLDAWSRLYLGYTSATDATAYNQTVSLPNVENNSSGAIYRINSGVFNNDYFLLENRQQTGNDSYLPGNGLLIWHVDDNLAGSNQYECLSQDSWECAAHFRVALKQADGLLQLENFTSSGNAGDPFPGSTVNTSFNFSTVPNNSSYYTDADPCFGVSSISASSSTMSAFVGPTCTYSPDPPANDLIENAEVISALPFSLARDVEYATTSVDDPPTCVTDVTNTVWFDYTTTARQSVYLHTYPSDFDTVMAVYDDNLTMLDCVDDTAGLGTASYTELDLQENTTYHIMVANKGSTPLSGPSSLRLSMDALTPSAGEIQALEDFYNSTGGSGWINSAGWLTGDDPCSWYGVYCTYGQVTNIELESNNLVGTLPSTIANLPYLYVLDVLDNSLSGTIPAELNSLPNLEWLDPGAE